MASTEKGQHPKSGARRAAPRGSPTHEGAHAGVEGRLHWLRDALRAAAQGDFSTRLPLDGGDEGIVDAVAFAFNSLMDRLHGLGQELERLHLAVVDEGRTDDRATLETVSGGWGDAIDSVNGILDRMAWPMTRATRVLARLAEGDLSRDPSLDLGGRPLQGDLRELDLGISAVVDRLRRVAHAVSTVGREVGREGRLGLQLEVDGLEGAWKEMIEDVNVFSSTLARQIGSITSVANAVANGDLSRKVEVEARGELFELKSSIDTTVDRLRSFAAEVIRVSREVGTEGHLGTQAQVPDVSGTWRELVDGVNMLAGNLTAQVRNIALVTTAVANGDLSKKITVEAKGEIEELKETINAMVDRLRTFASEVTRVAREVGTEGQLGGQARVPDVSGTWEDLTESVNLMASNLTEQVRGISRVVTAVANGDLSQRLFLIARGEIASLAITINGMTDTLRTFAEQVTSVAREVGIEGKLGGQAMVPRASGTWRDLTDNVNQLAANLTTQVRAISDVAASVTQGDLSQNISVEARGEVLALKDTINQMIANLRDTTQANTEQDWLKSNLARFFAIMQGPRSLGELTNEIMDELTPAVGAQHGAFYLFHEEGRRLELTSTYAHVRRHHLASRFDLGEGLVGQCALEKKPIVVRDVPDGYVLVTSGLGQAPAREIALFPILYEGKIKGVIELGSFHTFSPVQLNFLEQLMLNIGLSINLLGASRRTEQVLEQLQGSNVELESRRRELEEKAQLLEVRNREIADASTSLEAKAEELARVSKYKSQFLANMSHEIRTPLNSMLILAQMLASEDQGGLNERQREWASTIHSAGKDLLVLINQVLDLSRVEAGRIEAHLENRSLREVEELIERTFRPVALQKELDFEIVRSAKVPTRIVTDRQLLEPILLNLLSNAFKFTSEGKVSLRIERATPPRPLPDIGRPGATGALAFVVSDTGIGIADVQQRTIFEAFHQADGTITRRFEGTGLGLAISREYARILGGTIDVESEVDRGSTFTLYLPLLPADEEEPTVEVEEEERLAEGATGPAVEARPREAAPPLTAEDTRAIRGKKVLIVEDDVRNLYATTALLERLGMVVLTATDARAAWRKLEETPDVDVVLMDVMMPEIDGYQAIRTIRSMPAVAGVPIVVLTAKASRADRARALDAGGNDLVLKPAEIPDLVAAIRRNLRG